MQTTGQCRNCGQTQPKEEEKLENLVSVKGPKMEEIDAQVEKKVPGRENGRQGVGQGGLFTHRRNARTASCARIIAYGESEGKPGLYLNFISRICTRNKEEEPLGANGEMVEKWSVAPTPNRARFGMAP